MNINKCAGPDGLNPRILKALVPFISARWLINVNVTFETGGIPEDWMEATVSPIFKKGHNETPGTCRHVRFTSILCTMMEAI